LFLSLAQPVPTGPRLNQFSRIETAGGDGRRDEEKESFGRERNDKREFIFVASRDRACFSEGHPIRAIRKDDAAIKVPINIAQAISCYEIVAAIIVSALAITSDYYRDAWSVIYSYLTSRVVTQRWFHPIRGNRENKVAECLGVFVENSCLLHRDMAEISEEFRKARQASRGDEQLALSRAR